MAQKILSNTYISSVDAEKPKTYSKYKMMAIVEITTHKTNVITVQKLHIYRKQLKTTEY